MFRKIVTNLSFSPAASSQLSFYARRLRGERITRQLSAVMAVALVGVQVATIIAPPTSANASSANNVICEGLDASHPQKDLLNIYDTDHDSCGHTGYHQLFAHFGITREDLASTTHGTVHSGNHAVKSIGRETHSALDEPFKIGTQTFYLRPLYTWGDNIDYPALVGRKASNNGYFGILYRCGNISITDNTFDQPTTPQPIPVHTPPALQPVTPTPQPVTPTPQPVIPTPQPVTPTPQPVTPPPTPVTVTFGNAVLSKQKSAIIVSAADGSKHDTVNYQAAAGDVIEYTLTTTNSGTADAQKYAVSDQISDILEYADVLDTRGGTITDGVIQWPATNIKPGQSLLETFQVKVKTPIPTTPVSASDPQSFDLKLDNVYGNLVSVGLQVPAAKQVEVAAAALPATGAGTNALIVMALLAAISYFYFRNRQLITEISMLRTEHHGEVQ